MGTSAATSRSYAKRWLTQDASDPLLARLYTLLTLPLFIQFVLLYFTLYPPVLAPDNELGIALYRIRPQQQRITPSAWKNSALRACMPTVPRVIAGTSTHVEYVSNAAKSWYVAHDGHRGMNVPVLHVLDMTYPVRNASFSKTTWIRRIGGDANARKWLDIKHIGKAGRNVTRLTLGDSRERVEWRSKEACDYASVLRYCAKEAEMNNEDAFIVVQDDVLFTARIKYVSNWIRRVEEMGSRHRYCAHALFDVEQGDRIEENDDTTLLLRSSNLVARVWKIESARIMANYIEHHFDEAPVDWLVDKRCTARRAKTLVMTPNPVRHRGRVSSFEKNQRENLLT